MAESHNRPNSGRFAVFFCEYQNTVDVWRRDSWIVGSRVSKRIMNLLCFGHQVIVTYKVYITAGS